MKALVKRLLMALGVLSVPSMALAVWTPLVTSDMFTGAQTDVLTAVGSILSIFIILFAAGVIMHKL
jgi:hypothetical protein